MRSSLLVCLSFLLAGAAQAQDLNVITAVEVRAEGSSVVVTVKGSKPPNFTTFSMADPARFVIDLSESRFQGVPEDLKVEDGVIRVIKNLAYGSGANSIARVMLAFSLDVEPPDVQTDGTSLVVKVIRPGAPAVAATGARPPEPAAAPLVAAPSVAAAVPDATAAAARAEAEEAARQEALAREVIEAEAREQARLAAESSAKEREAQARAEVDARARAAERVAAEQAAADQAAGAAAEARRAEIKAKVAEAEVAPAVEAKPTAESQAAQDEARARREIEEALAAQQAVEARTAAAAAPPPQVTPPATPASPATAPSAASPVASLSEIPPARPARLQAVGFTQLPTVSRVFVKTSETPRFTITDVGDDVVRLEVENTRVSRRNDTRPLDTSFFPSAVAMITPSRQGTSYVVDIKLKKRVPYQQKVEGSVLAIDFERPAALSAPASSPAGGAAAAGSDNQQGLTVVPDEKAEQAGPGQTDSATEPSPKP